MVKRKKKKKNPAAVVLSRLGARKGGKARTASMTAEERRALARKGARARWGRRGRGRRRERTGGGREDLLGENSPEYVTYAETGGPIYRFTGRYHEGPLADAFGKLANGESAAKELVAALREHRRLPFRETMEHARLSACLRYQLHRFGWESLPKKWWDEVEEIVERHPYCRLEDIGQEDRFLRAANGESTEGMGVGGIV